ncbi:nitroreductase family protein [Myxococcota bacterium]|nr:nitroreductase family protein [Myxococcota bacterium]
MHMLDLTPDDLLTTTRSVRKRLDFDRPVSRELISECLEVAFQAPNGSNMNSWRWVVVDDPERVAAAAGIYNAGLDDYIASLGDAVGESYMGAQVPRYEMIGESVAHLRENMHRSPALLIPLFAGRTEEASVFFQASLWGSVIQATWSFFLALRARGLGSAWTTGHLFREKEMAELLGIPLDLYTQVGLFPIAYTIGTDFRAAYRKPVSEVVGWNQFEV